MSHKKRLEKLIAIATLQKKQIGERVGVTPAYIGHMTAGRAPVTESVLQATEELAAEQIAAKREEINQLQEMGIDAR